MKQDRNLYLSWMNGMQFFICLLYAERQRKLFAFSEAFVEGTELCGTGLHDRGASDWQNIPMVLN